MERPKTLSQILFSTPQISESIPFLFVGGTKLIHTHLVKVLVLTQGELANWTMLNRDRTEKGKKSEFAHSFPV